MFRYQETGNGCQIEFGSNLDAIEKVDRRVTELLDRCDVNVDKFAIRILLHEALVNAVVHGNGEDPSRSVSVKVTSDEKGVSLFVQDAGSGFSQDAITDSPDRLEAGGRGLLLMKSYADEVSYNDAGNCVHLWKRVRQPGESGQHNASHSTPMKVSF
ncbi:MAG: ATP-binding protein [Planctomycetota bacterium]|jgi:anti-sigma regulatory factor (Ser/Thr protein kinase)